MRKMLPVTTLLVLLPALIAQEPAQWAEKLFEGQLSHDFGPVQHGTLVKHSFKITNIYKVPLDITEVRGSCGCVTAESSVKSLPPGASGLIHVTIDTRQFVGPRTVNVDVKVGPRFVSVARLTLSANARGDVVFTPKELDFGTQQRGQTPSKSFDIEYTGSLANWHVIEILKSASAPFELKAETLPNGPDGVARRGYRVTATLKSDAPAGAFKQELSLKTNDANAPVLRFDVIGTIQSGLSVSPNPIVLGSMKVGESQTKKVFVRGAKAFKILKIEDQGDGIKVDLPTQKDTTQVLSVQIAATKVGPLRRVLVIRTDLDKDTTTLTIEGSVEP